MNKVQVVSGGDPCAKCGDEPRLTAVINAETGAREVALCGQCDAKAPGAKDLVEYFEIYDSVQPQDASYVSGLLGQWLASLRTVKEMAPAQRSPKSDLAAEAEAWWAGYK